MNNIKIKKSNITKYMLQCAGICLSLFIVKKMKILLNAELLIAPFGASCAILFCFAESPFSKPRNIIGGYFISSLFGVVSYYFWGSNSWSIALSVSVSIFVMLVTNSMHPPAGAVPIIALTSASHWTFILFPVVTGSLTITIAAILHHKLVQKIYSINTDKKEERMIDTEMLKNNIL